MVFKGELAVKLHAKDVEVGAKSPWGLLTVLDQLTTKALVLFGFSIVHQ